MKNNIPKETLMEIHRALHDLTAQKVVIDNVAQEIGENAKGCREVFYKGIRFIQQNTQTSSIYATMAKKGEKITWGITYSGSTPTYKLRIIGDTIEMNNL